MDITKKLVKFFLFFFILTIKNGYNEKKFISKIFLQPSLLMTRKLYTSIKKLKILKELDQGGNKKIYLRKRRYFCSNFE